MIKINSSKVLESSNPEIVSAMVVALPKASLLVALGLAEMPKVGQLVKKYNALGGRATITRVDLVQAKCLVDYTAVKYYNKDGSDYEYAKSDIYCVEKAEKSKSQTWITFDELEYWTGDTYALQA